MTFCELTGVGMKENELPGALPDLDQLKAKLKDYEVALEFYAKKKNYNDERPGHYETFYGDCGYETEWDYDQGDTARAALEKYKTEETK